MPNAKGGFVTVSSNGFDSGCDFLSGNTELVSGGTAIGVTSIAFGVLIETASGRTALAFGNVLPAVISSWRHAARRSQQIAAYRLCSTHRQQDPLFIHWKCMRGELRNDDLILWVDENILPEHAYAED